MLRSLVGSEMCIRDRCIYKSVTLRCWVWGFRTAMRDGEILGKRVGVEGWDFCMLSPSAGFKNVQGSVEGGDLNVQRCMCERESLHNAHTYTPRMDLSLIHI
eukprot:TRINITY_DN25549_c0_g1_i3.p1 TRINITY_DN25549_c0_g1~~TRINITY_DN25549_c0_g1_i3.p1  ORF type:complete len:102 (-),score=11.58 TRINITY_DN25549_c0_g1_i3:161-466(-)